MLHILIQIIAFVGVGVGVGVGVRVRSWRRGRASERVRGRRGSERAGFRASSAVHGLTNYLWNCCIHSHLNRNLSERRGGEGRPRRSIQWSGPLSVAPPLQQSPRRHHALLLLLPPFFSCFCTGSLFASASLSPNPGLPASSPLTRPMMMDWA